MCSVGAKIWPQVGFHVSDLVVSRVLLVWTFDGGQMVHVVARVRDTVLEQVMDDA